MILVHIKFPENPALALKAPITTAPDDKVCDIFSNFRKKGMIFYLDRLPADDPNEISYLICYF